MFDLDITMTASLRKEIVDETLSSLKENLICNGNLILIIDIAPIGDLKQKQNDVLNVCNKYIENGFLRDVIARIINPSLQADAQKWVWDQSQSPYILQWEDDWVLLKKINIENILKHFNTPSDKLNKLGIIYLDRAEKPIKTYKNYQGRFKKFDNSLWLRIAGKSLGGPPALIKRKYMRKVCTFILPNECLDITTQKPDVQAFLNKWDHGVYLGEDGGGELVKDIGKAWLKSKGMKRVKRTNQGVKWIKK